MSNSITVVQPNDDHKVIYGAGDEYHYLATGKETDGQYFANVSVVPPGGGLPPHIQTREEELFYILEGEITFYAEGKTTLAGPGTFLNVPKGVRHRFRNESDEDAKMIILFSPAGLEEMFDEMGANEASYKEHPKGVLYALNKVGAKYGVQFFEEDE